MQFCVRPLTKFVLFLILSLIWSCADSQKADDLNPMQPDSELALLMREMFDDAMQVKQQVKAGEELSGLNRFEEIHHAIPTDPEASGPLFDAFAQAYIESVRVLEESDTSTTKYFNSMVHNCMNCHTEFCPGPKMRIKKLYLK